MLRNLTILQSAFLLILFSSPVLADSNIACGLYYAEPPFLSDSVTPSTHILLDNSGSMHNYAYADEIQDKAFCNDNGNNYVAFRDNFNSTKKYYGYFDSKKYYTYSENQYFEVSLDGKWNGNFLNWALMHRVDIVRKVLTGGPYDATDGTYKIEQNDGRANLNAMYRLYDDTSKVEDLNESMSHMTPYGGGKIALKQSSVINDDYLYIGKVSTVVENTWTISEIVENKFRQKVKSDEIAGVLDNFETSLRFSLFKFDHSEGARIVHDMGSNATYIKNSINEIYPSTWTPLAESLYTICGYIRQDKVKDKTPPRYTSGSYTIPDDQDPYYFEDINDTIYCSQQNVVIITDGEPTEDTNVPNLITTGTYKGKLDQVAHWAHTTDMRGGIYFPGKQTVNIYTVFTFGKGSELLKSTAKYGGFIDLDGGTANLPDPGEYDKRVPGTPDNFFEAESGEQLEEALNIVFKDAQNRISGGAAASVVSTSKSGQGLLYQSVFYPKLYGDKDSKTSTDWAGDILAYWIDDYGILREDSNEDGQLDEGDKRVIVFNDGFETLACIGGEVINGTCSTGGKPIADVKFVWKASDWINSIPNETIISNRNSLFSDENKRYIFTWNDNGDGAVDNENEFIPFTTDYTNSSIISDQTVNWIRGYEDDTLNLRSRKISVDNNDVIWRLGDIINSSAVAVGQPSENYDLIWRDKTYTAYYQQWKNRRKMIYFGGNDGMLHAINGGFYDSTTKKYFRHYSEDTKSYSDSGGLPIGAEMWAYVPYNLLPHLECLTNKAYQHQYYVDLSPRVFDARIFDDRDPDHPNGWGTIMVTGMRFGGDGNQNLVKNGRTFGSSYFIFDITNPEKDPQFLGEFTFDINNPYKLGFTISSPTLVPVRDTTLLTSGNPSDNIHWYMVFGSGPDTTAGTSSSKDSKVIVVPLSKITKFDETEKITIANPDFPLRLDSSVTSNSLSKTTLGHQSIPIQNSFVSTDFASVDYDFDFFVDILYYGVTEKQKNKNFEGSMHRLKIENKPDPKNWGQMKMVSVPGAITGTPNVGFHYKNVWVYFGTGKFLDTSDKTDTSPQTLYGVMDAKFIGKAYNFSNVSLQGLVDVTNVEVSNNGTGELICTGPCTDLDNVAPKTVFGLVDHIVDNKVGWKRNLRHRERVIGQPTLFGGLVNFVTYTPNDDPCTYGGKSSLYALYYLTGTAWIENIFGDGSTDSYVPFLKELGTGMGTTASLHIGSQDGTKAFITLDDGTLVEVDEPNLPIKRVRTGKGGWHTIGLD